LDSPWQARSTLCATTRINVPRALTVAAFVSAVMLVGACGGTVADSKLSSTPAGGSTPSASANAGCTTSARSVCVTASPNGRNVTVGVGWTVRLNLDSPNSVWSAPSEHGASLLRQIGGVRRRGGTVEVAYRTIAAGRTELRASERPVCPPAHMCPQYVLVWEARILVTDS